jgi:hypothetical protein
VTSPEQQYRADPGVNFSTLKLMARSPAAYRYGYGADDDDTASRMVLRLIHATLLEPHAIPRDFYCIPDTVRRGPAVTAEAGARTVVKAADLATAQAMAAAVAAHPVAGPMLAAVPASHREHTVRWYDPPTGLPCKGRLDALAMAAPGQGAWATVIDLKTVRSVHPREIARMAASMHWHVQAAHYAAGVRANHGLTDDAVDAVLIVMEQAPPHDVGVYRLTPDGALWAGEVTRRAWLDRLAECLRANTWPGACPLEQELDLPGWAYPDAAGGQALDPAAGLDLDGVSDDTDDTDNSTGG